MPRPLRTDFEGAIHHVMNRGVDRQRVFFADADRVEFGRRLANIHADFGVETLAYCLMDNHYHLLLRTPNGDLSSAMQQLGGLYTRHTNDRIGRDGPLFRGRFHSILVTTDRYLMWVTRYIHRNPLDISGITNVVDYRWSSFRAYVGLRPSAPFLNTGPVLSLFGGDRGQLVETTTDHTRSILDSGSISAEDLEQLASLASAEHDLECETSTDVRRMKQSLLLATIAHLDRPDLRDDVLARFDFPSNSARRMATHRARRKFTADPALTPLFDRFLTTIGEQRPAA